MTASVCRKTCFGKRGLHIEKDSEDDPAVFRLSWINKVNVEDLSASKNITERFFRQQPLFEYSLIWDTMYSRNA